MYLVNLTEPHKVNRYIGAVANKNKQLVATL